MCFAWIKIRPGMWRLEKDGFPIASVCPAITDALYEPRGAMWKQIRKRAWLPPSVAASFSKAALDARIWIVALLTIFVYGIAPEVYRRAVNPPSIQVGPSSATGTTGVPLQQLIGKHFENQEVRLDGKWFINCTFENVTIEYNGGPMRVDNPTRKGTFAFKTNSVPVSGSVEVLRMFGVLTPEFVEKWQLNQPTQP